MGSEKIKALVMGDYKDAPYHPMNKVEGIFSDILSENFTLDFCEERSMMELDNLNKYGLILVYFDSIKTPLESRYIANLMTYVAQGGALLVIHNGMVSYQERREYVQLVGAKFIGHAKYRTLDFKVKKEGHPITEGINDFSMGEEPYRFLFCNLNDYTPLMEYDDNGEMKLCSWCHNYGIGRVVYLHPGHDIASFSNPEYQKLIQRSALWVAKKL